MPAPPSPAGESAASSSRCPGCGSGDLFAIEVRQRGGGAWRGVYCAGEYDRRRRRFLRRSCGYAGARVDDADAPGAHPERSFASAG